MLAFENLPMLQRPFITSFEIYIDSISFSFSTIHFTIVWLIGRYTTNEAFTWTGSYGLGFAIGIIGMMATTLMTIWIADIHWRLLDHDS
jgi:uncharacterized membrane protein